MLARLNVMLVAGLMFLLNSQSYSCRAQEKPSAEQERAQSEENDHKKQDVERQVESSLPPLEATPQGTANFLSPQHDIRLALDFGFLAKQITQFYGLGYGDTIDLRGPGCGYSHFLVAVNDGPSLSQTAFLTSSGVSGTYLKFFAGENAQSGPCFFNDHPSIGAGVSLRAGLQNISNIEFIRLDGLAYIAGIVALWPFMQFPFHIDIPFEGKPLSTIPIKFKDSPSTKVDFGSFQNNNWVSTGSEKTLQLIVNAGGFSATAPQRDFLIADAAVGTSFSTKSFPDEQQAQQDFSADIPIWNPDNQQIGLSLGLSFFGDVSPNKAGTGVFGTLLPIRIQTIVDRKILFFHIRKKIEVFLDGAHAAFEPHEGSTGVRVNLSSSRWAVHNLNTEKAAQPSRILKSVTASVLFDRFTLGDEQLNFRVADFRLKIRTRWFVFPVTLSSGQLQENLDGGVLPLAGIKSKFSIDLPPCVKTNTDSLWSAQGTCTNLCPQRKGCLSVTQGYPSIIFALDPKIQVEPSGNFLHLAIHITATKGQSPATTISGIGSGDDIPQ